MFLVILVIILAQSLSKKFDIHSLVKLDVRSKSGADKYCQFDNAILHWNNYCVDCKLALKSLHSNVTMIFDVCSNPPLESPVEEVLPKYITCELSPSTCIPVVNKITILNNRLHLEFLEKTNGVLLNSTTDIIKALHFEPPLFYNFCLPQDEECNHWFSSNKWNISANNIYSSWNNSNLELILSGDSTNGSFPYLNQLYQAHAEQRKIAFTPYLPPHHASFSVDSVTRCGTL